MLREQTSYPAKKKQGIWKRQLKGIFYAICIALVIRVVIIEPYRIPSESMYPSILKGDMLMANKFVYGVFFPVIDLKIPGFVDPKSGDIVLFQSPSYQSPGKLREIVNFVTFGIFNLDNNSNNPRYFIKRAIGVPGDRITMADPRENQFAFQIMRNGETNSLSPLSSNLPSLGDLLSEDFLFFQEKGNPAVIQYQKNRAMFFRTQDHDTIDNLYVPKKGDELEFVLISDPGTPKKMAQEAKDNGKILDVSYNAKIKLIVERNEGGSKVLKFDGIVSGRTFGIFYYSQRPNAILSPKDIYGLYFDGHVQLRAKDDYYFMVGDNRDDSEDSRYWGFVPYRYIIGSPMVRYWPFSRFGSVNYKS